MTTPTPAEAAARLRSHVGPGALTEIERALEMGAAALEELPRLRARAEQAEEDARANWDNDLALRDRITELEREVERSNLALIQYENLLRQARAEIEEVRDETLRKVWYDLKASLPAGACQQILNREIDRIRKGALLETSAAETETSGEGS